MTTAATTDPLGYQEVLADLGRQAIGGDGLDRLLADAAEAVADALGTEYAMVLERLPAGDGARLRGATGWADDRVRSAVVPADEGTLVGATLSADEPLVADDLRADTRFAVPDQLIEWGPVSGVTVAVGDDEPWGVLGVFAAESREFDARDATFLDNVADLLAPAVRREPTSHEFGVDAPPAEILEASPVGITVLDADGEVRFANERAETILGRCHDHITSLTHDDSEWDLVDERGDPMDPADTPLAEVRSSGEPISDVEIGVARPDGRRVWLSVDGTPLRANGDVTGAVFAFEDVTGHKHVEHELEEVFGRISDAFFALDEEWRFTYLNERAHELINPTGRILEGKNVWDEFPQAVSRAFKEQYERAMAEQETVTFEEYYPEPLDSWFEVRAYPSDSGLSVYFRDVTEHKVRERDLELFRTLLDHSNDSVMVIDPATAAFVDANDTACRRLGYSREELLSLTVPDIERGLADMDEWQAHVDDVRGEGAMTFPGRHERADGSTYPAEVNVVHVSLDQEYMVAVARDVSDRRERARELERKERRYEAVFEDPNILVGLLEPDGTVLDINQTAMEYIEADLEAVTGEPFWETPWWGEGEDVRAEVRDWTERAAAGEYVDFEAELTRPDGEAYALSGYFRPVTDEDGEVVSIIVSDRDVTERKQRERELAESEQRYRTLVENFPNGSVGLFDEDLEYTAVGGQLLAALDMEPKDRIGRKIPEVHPDDVVEEIEPYFHAALEGEANAFEIEGHDRHLYAHTLPVRNADGEVYAGMLVVQDVTERREAQRELRESEARFRMIAENLDEIVWMASADAEEFLYINPAFEDVWGLQRDDLYEDPMSFLDAVHPDDHDRVAAAFASLPEEGFDEEYRIVRPDGEVRWMYARGTQVTDGDMTRIVGIGEDITEQVEREAELERALDLLERTERIADVGGWEIDPDTMDVFWSDHIFELLDMDGDVEPPLDEALDMYHEVDKPVVEAAVEDALVTSEPFDVEARVHTDAGDLRWLRLQGVPEAEGGDVVSFRGAAQDITEHKRREQKLEELVEKLEESNERLEQFAYAASHDLKEPLRMVSSYLQLVERRYGDQLDEGGEEFIEFAVDGADRMREMIDGLLQYSRVETRGDPFEAVDLDDAFEDALRDLEVKIDEHDADIAVESLPRVHGDAGQLTQVFQNLLSNAIEYSGDELPSIDVSAKRDGDQWVIAVCDEGVGIDPDDADRVFEVFQSLHVQQDHAGTGIGLALCERIVERHGGDIWVESEPGKGSTFFFTLPAVGATDD